MFPHVTFPPREKKTNSPALFSDAPPDHNFPLLAAVLPRNRKKSSEKSLSRITLWVYGAKASMVLFIVAPDDRILGSNLVTTCVFQPHVENTWLFKEDKKGKNAASIFDFFFFPQAQQPNTRALAWKSWCQMRSERRGSEHMQTRHWGSMRARFLHGSALGLFACGWKWTHAAGH